MTKLEISYRSIMYHSPCDILPPFPCYVLMTVVVTNTHKTANTNLKRPKYQKFLIIMFVFFFCYKDSHFTPSYIPQIHLANCMSFGITVTLLACIAHKLACSSRPMRNASPASCRAFTAIPWNLRLAHLSCTISWTSLWNGRHQMRSSDVVWYFLKSFQALIALLIFFLVLFSTSILPFLSFFPPVFFSFTSSISFTLFTFSTFIIFNSALVSVFFVFWAISINKDKFHFTTSIPILNFH